MRNFTDAQNALVTAIGSTNSAWEENARYMESIEAHQNKLKAEWEKLVLSAPIEDLEKALLKAATAILEFANSGIGQAIIKITLWTTAIMGLVMAFSALGTAIAATNIGTAISMAIEAIAVYKDLTMAIDLLTASMNINPLFLGATLAIAGTIALVALVDKLTVSFEEATEALEKSTKALNDSQNTINSLESDLKNLQQTIADLEKQKLEITDDEELKKLNQQTQQLKHQEALLKSQLTLEQQKLKALQDEAKLNADRLFNPQNKGYTETSYNKYDFAGGTKSAYDYGTKDTASGGIDVALNQQITNVENLNQRIEKLNQNLEVLRNNGEENSQLAIEYATEINDLNTLLVEEENSMNANAEALINAKVAGYELSDAQEQILERYNALNGVTDSVVESIDDYEEAESEATDAMNDFLSSAESLQSAYESLSKAADEYNKNGIISASTLKKLSKLNPEYIAQLEVVNGKMQVGNGLLQEEFEYEKQLALISIDTAKQLRIQAVCQEYSNDKTQEAKTATQEATPEIDAMASALNKLGVEGLNAARGVEAARAAVKGDEQAEADLNQKLQDIDDWANGMKDSINAVNLGAVESSKSAAGASKDAWVEAFEEEQRLLKHSLEMNEITEYEYYQKLIDLNEKYFGEISGKHQKYLKEYQENEEEIYKGLKSVYDKVANYLKEAIEQGYEDAINAIKKEEKRILDEIKAQIEALKDEKKKVLQDITDQINNLKKKKDKIQDYWNSQIDKIKESNEQLQKQNELLEKQQALQRAKAQKVMVMKGGKFQLSENESAVSQAEQSLSEYEDQYSYEQQISEMEKLRDAEVKTIDDRIEKLEAHKEYMERYYDDQIDALERYRDEVEQQYEKQIDALQEQLDAFKKSCQQQEKLEEARLASQVAGINSETDLFKISLANLKTYVDKYNEIMKARATLDKSGKVSSGGETSANADFQTATSQGISSNADGVPTQLRASGDAYFRNDEVALVGESPNAELVLGSNLNRSVNSGTLVHLAKGSGVVNAESTATLAGLLNSIEPQKSTSIGRSVNQTFTFSNLTLPNVTDADSFVNALSNKFNNYAIQYSNIRN